MVQASIRAKVRSVLRRGTIAPTGGGPRTVNTVFQSREAAPLVDLLTGVVRAEAEARFAHLKELERSAPQSIEARRAYVSAVLGLQVWSHKLALAAHAGAHGDGHG